MTADKNGYEGTKRTEPTPEKDSPERVILIGVVFEPDPGGEEEAERSMSELALLAESAGAVVAGRALQKRVKPDAVTYIGKGKLMEVSDAADALNAGTLVFDDELSGAQLRNIEEQTGRKVLDRTLLIMDIFAGRAKSREGRLQVELAQQRYRLSRLVGIGKGLSRQGGGIGTRGPGESRLESDRRHIARRIKILSDAIAEVRGQRERTREGRRQSEIFSIAFVGYTNAGKSTLINALCDTSLYTEDRVFATLDPAVRRLPLDASVQAVAVDTVGFIRKLPHHLVDAFKSTLEEAVLADLIVMVVDASDPDRLRQIEVVEEILRGLDAADRPRLTVFNKTDRAGLPDGTSVLPLPEERMPSDVFEVSAITGQGLERLRAALRARAEAGTVRIRLRIPYAESGLVDELHRSARVESLSYSPDGIEIDAVVPVSRLTRFTRFQVQDS